MLIRRAGSLVCAAHLPVGSSATAPPVGAPPRERVPSEDEPARAAEELQAEITAAYRDAITRGDPGDLRRAEAAERLLSRVYGRPTERVEQTVTVPESIEQLRAMSSEERRALLLEYARQGKLPSLHAVPEDEVKH